MLQEAAAEALTGAGRCRLQLTDQEKQLDQLTADLAAAVQLKDQLNEEQLNTVALLQRSKKLHGGGVVRGRGW